MEFRHLSHYCYTQLKAIAGTLWSIHRVSYHGRYFGLWSREPRYVNPVGGIVLDKFEFLA